MTIETRGRLLQGGLYGILVVLIPIVIFVGDARWQDKDAAAQSVREVTAQATAAELANAREHAAILRILSEELTPLKVDMAAIKRDIAAILARISMPSTRTAARGGPP